MSEKPKPMGLYCSISGILPDIPVVSAKSGHVFEKRLIEQALEASGGRCPETGESLAPSDLIEVRKSGTVVEPTVPADVSVPGVLRHLQKEWDTTMLEMHQVKTKLNETRKELASALYKYETAERVVARLTQQLKESGKTPEPIENRPTDEKEGLHANGNGPVDPVPASKGSSSETEAMIKSKSGREAERSAKEVNATANEATTALGTDKMQLPPQLLEQALQRAKELQAKRKERKVPKSHSSASMVSTFSEGPSLSIDESDVSVTTLARGAGGLVFAGTGSGRLCEFSVPSLSMKGTHVVGHESSSGGVSRVRYDAVADRVVSCGGDGLVKTWDVQGEWKEMGCWKHGSRVVEVDLHPLKGLVLAVLWDGGWVWRELDEGGRVACHGRGEMGYASGAVHPDGMVFGLGRKDGVVEMWDVNSMQCVAKLGERGGEVKGLEMSEKGYYMATCKDESVQMWDLRKQGMVGEVGVVGAWGVAFDGIGEFGCAVGEGGVTVFAGKKKAKVLGQVPCTKWTSPKSGRGGCLWGDDAKLVLAGGGDGIVRQFGGGVQ